MGQTASDINSVSTETLSSRIQILGTTTIIRPEGYALPNHHATSVIISHADEQVTGYGEGDSQTALDKALSEAIERSMLIELRKQTGRRESSNGWACHLTADLAIDAALFELIERDVALSTWQAGGPFFLIPNALWPVQLQDWRSANKPRAEFFDLKVLISETTNGACISAMLFNDRGNFVAGHGSGLNLEDAILSASAECFRSAHAAIRFEHFIDVLHLHEGRLVLPAQPGAHSLAYAYGVSIPSVVSIVQMSTPEIRKIWARHVTKFRSLDRSDFTVTLFPVEERVVARVKGQRYQEIFWGSNPIDSKFKNNSPHCVG